MISAGPLIDYAPLVKFNDGGVNTQFDMIWVEKIGLLKMDFLGLRNLTVMNSAVDEIRRTVDRRSIWPRSRTTTSGRTRCSAAARRWASSSSNPTA